MAKVRFVEAATDRIPLSDGDWIEVKRDLNTGDQKKLEAAGLKPPTRVGGVGGVGGEIITPIDWEIYEIHRAAVFLTDWSFRGLDDKPFPLNNRDGQVSIDALKALDPETFDEINKAIFAHVIKRAAEKNGQRVVMPDSQMPREQISTPSASPDSVQT